ncbi:MAG: radical SAM protein [bacterium]
MARCAVCGAASRVVSAQLEVCGPCLREGSARAMARAEAVHRGARREFGLPTNPPSEGASCGWCANGCRIAEGERGFCGVRRNEGGRVCGGTPREGLLSWYHDPLPTNCVAGWVCPGSGDRGRTNLAVFYESCSFDCLFCQNWHYRGRSLRPARTSAETLARAVDARTGCICYFGGEPTTQAEHALAASRLALERAGPPGLRVCWESNGAMAPGLLERMAEVSLATDGCIKFDLKAWAPSLHRALCGAGNERTLGNFARLAELARRRPEPPLAVASTLLVPGYVDAREVGGVAQFIAELDPSIPYSLLGFHPDFYLCDLPRTSQSYAQECLAAACEAGLRRVHVGNLHVLGRDY